MECCLRALPGWWMNFEQICSTLQGSGGPWACKAVRERERKKCEIASCLWVLHLDFAASSPRASHTNISGDGVDEKQRGKRYYVVIHPGLAFPSYQYRPVPPVLYCHLILYWNFKLHTFTLRLMPEGQVIWSLSFCGDCFLKCRLSSHFNFHCWYYSKKLFSQHT